MAANTRFSFTEPSSIILSYLEQDHFIGWSSLNCYVVSYEIRSDFIQPSIEYGLQSDSIEVFLSYNTTEAPREGYIDFLVRDIDGNDKIYTYTIQQERGRPLFSVASDTVYMSNSQSSKGIDIKFNGNYIIHPRITSDSPWLSGDIDYYGINSILNINCEPNPFIERRGTLTISYESETEYDWQTPLMSQKVEISVIQEKGTSEDISYVTFDSEYVDIDPLKQAATAVKFTLHNGAKVKELRIIEGDFFETLLNTVYGNDFRVRAKRINDSGETLRGKLEVIATDASETYEISYPFDVIQEPINIRFDYDTIIFNNDGSITEDSTNTVRILGDTEYISDVNISNLTDWIHYSYNNKKKFFTFAPTYNASTEERNITLDITIEYNGQYSLLRRLTLIQYGDKPSTEEPIWKDTTITLSKVDYTNYKSYRLVNDATNEEIYRGSLFFINDTIEINVADICKDHIDININPFDNEFTDNKGYINVRFEISLDNNTFETVNTYHLYNNYEYDYSNVRNTHLTNPIQDYVDYRQNFVYSVQNNYKEEPKTLSITYNSNKPYTNEYTLSNGQFTICRNAIGDSITVDYGYERTFNVLYDGCYDYCLYYLNCKGGWSWYLINGTTLKNNKIATNSYNKNVSNLKPSTFSKCNYLKQITRSWKFNTEYLTDEQSEKMQDLLTSPIVYLHDLNNDIIIAVTIDETSVDVKTFENQKHKPYAYTFTVTESQTRVRR